MTQKCYSVLFAGDTVACIRDASSSEETIGVHKCVAVGKLKRDAWYL